MNLTDKTISIPLTARYMAFVLLTFASISSIAQGVLYEPIPSEDRIAFTLYTVHEQTLKLTAQFNPIKDYEPFEAYLQVKNGANWETIANSDIRYPGYTAHFRIDNWDDSKQQKYRVTHNNRAFYDGIIQANPVHKDTIIMASLSCNSQYPQHGGTISKNDIVDNLKKSKIDLVFFAGDQVYDHSQHYIYWLQFGKEFGEILRNTPSIVIPDDHDIGQGNIWGAGGKKAKSRNGTDGGYYLPPSYIEEVQRAQTSHLPDPYDPTPILQDISVYYTDLKWGGISFAILEDRKFKSGPEGLVKHDGARIDLVTNPEVDTKKFDHPDAKLLGERQLKFLESWSTDWQDAEMKAVLSQTIFAMSSNYTGKQDVEIIADFDTNGWPQTGRNKALESIRKSYSVMIAGDQHLGSVIKHGIDDWGDAGYSICSPAIANYWLRWWHPKEPGTNRKKGAPNYTGDFLDGFGNKMTILATANPTNDEIENRGVLSTSAAGFNIIKFVKSSRDIVVECWPRNVDVLSGEQFSGWPISFKQEDNYVIKEGFSLPRLIFKEEDPVVTIRRSRDNELISSLRVNGSSYQPRVPDQEAYNVIILQNGEEQTLKQLTPSRKNKKIYVD